MDEYVWRWINCWDGVLNGDGLIFWDGWLGCIWSRSGMEIDGFLEMDEWLRMEMDG